MKWILIITSLAAPNGQVMQIQQTIPGWSSEQSCLRGKAEAEAKLHVISARCEPDELPITPR